MAVSLKKDFTGMCIKLTDPTHFQTKICSKLTDPTHFVVKMWSGTPADTHFFEKMSINTADPTHYQTKIWGGTANVAHFEVEKRIDTADTLLFMVNESLLHCDQHPFLKIGRYKHDSISAMIINVDKRLVNAYKRIR